MLFIKSQGMLLSTAPKLSAPHSCMGVAATFLDAVESQNVVFIKKSY